jgi:hypothetical protein
MVRQCLESNVQILFNPSALKDIGIQPTPTDNTEKIKYEAPIDHDRNDAVCKPHTPFKIINGWWILELIPMRRKFPPIENGKVVQNKKWKWKIQLVVLWSLCAVLRCGILNTTLQNQSLQRL